MISEILNYMAQHQQIASKDMAISLGITLDALEPILNLLEKKNKIKRLPPETRCAQSCSFCDPSTVVLYTLTPPDA